MSIRLILYVILIAVCLSSCKQVEKDEQSDITTSTIETHQPAEIIEISSLDDTLKPKNIYLKDSVPPSVKSVSISQSISTTITNARGDREKITLEPPINKPLPILINSNGEPIVDSKGKNFVLGNVGKSNITNFTTNEGLALDGIKCSMMDGKGNLWFGTAGGGVSKYDGYNFTTYTTAQGLAGNIILSILEDKKENIWIATNGGGVSKFDGITFANYTTEDGLGNNAVNCIAEDSQGNLWFGTVKGGVSKFDGTDFTTLTKDDGLKSSTVYSILEDQNGNMWFGYNNGGLAKYNGKSFENFDKDDGLANNTIWCITEDSKGNLWFGTFEGGVSKYDGKTFKNYNMNDGLAYNSINVITEDSDGNIWFGTEGNGVSKFDGKRFVSYTTSQGLANDAIYSITEDLKGNLWFGTYGGGLSRYSGSAFVNVTTDYGLTNNTVSSIEEDTNGNLWFGTYGGGVSKFDGIEFTNFTTSQGLSNNTIYSIKEDSKGNLWFGTNGNGVCKFDGRSFTSFTKNQGLASNIVYSILEDSKGIMWFGTYGGGVSQFDGESFVNYGTEQGISNNVVWNIAEDKDGNLWFGTNGNGVSKFDGKAFINYNTNQGLADNTVYTIEKDSIGNLWFGTANGLSVLKNKYFSDKDGKAKFRSFTTSEGLPDNFITQIKVISGSKLAVGTNLGITTFEVGKELEELSNIEIYNTQTGFPVKDINVGQNCMFIDNKGVLWAGTGSENTALVRFDIDELKESRAAPNLKIKSIKVNEENLSWFDVIDKGKIDSTQIASNITEEVTIFGVVLNEKKRGTMRSKFKGIQFDSISPFYYLPQNLILPYEHNHLTIDFNAIETDKPSSINYQYFLEGYDKDWSPVLKKTSASFGNIYEGEYVFKVKAQGPEGIWSSPLEYRFEVLPPWYRTWWAYLSYAIVAIVVLYLLFKWRMAALRKDKERLEKTVVERTAEVVAEKKEADRQRERSDELLLNILPAEIAEELKDKGQSDAKDFELVSILFTDFKGFTQASEKLTAKQLVEEIDTCFKKFDAICGKYNVEKIKTIGDAYMAAGGLPIPDDNSVKNTLLAALEMSEFIKERKIQLENEGRIPFEMRLGIHTGPVVAGIVGIKKFQYDIWGDTVNTASRMESSGEPGRVNISQTTYEILKEDPQFEFTPRGKIIAKGKGEMEMYFVNIKSQN